MLQDFRDNLGTTTKIVLVVIVSIPFALFGVDALFSSGSGKEAANVNGQSISEQRLRQALQMQKQQLAKRYKNLDPSELEDDKLRPKVLKELVRQEAVKQAARDKGMGVAKSTIDTLLNSVEDFKTDGKFDPERYRFILGRMGYSPSSYDRQLRSDMLINQFAQGVVATGFATNFENELLIKAAEQSRTFEFLTVPVAPIRDKVAVADDTLSTYYDDHKDEFMTPEKLVVDYIELTPALLMGEVSVDDEQLEDFYQSKLKEAEEIRSRKVAQILIEKQKDGSHQKKVDDVIVGLANKENFSELAKTYSEDVLTAEGGGLLGFVQTGELPEQLDKALSLMEVGGVSDAIETEDGVYFLQLQDEKASPVPEKESLRPQLQQQLANELLPERIEELKDLSYNAASLQEVADQMGLTLQTSEPISKQGAAAGILANPKVLGAAFSDEVRVDKRASEVLEIADDHVVVVALKEQQLPKQRTLDEVKPEITAIIKRQKAGKLMANHLSSLLKQLNEGKSLASLAKTNNYKQQSVTDAKRNTGGVAPEVLSSVFKLPTPEGDLAENSYFTLADGNGVLVSLSKVTPGDFNKITEQQQRAVAATTELMRSSQEYRAYEDLLVKDADVAAKYNK